MRNVQPLLLTLRLACTAAPAVTAEQWCPCLVVAVTSAGEILVLGHRFTPPAPAPAAARCCCTTTAVFTRTAVSHFPRKLGTRGSLGEISEQQSLTRDYFRTSALNIFDIF